MFALQEESGQRQRRARGRDVQVSGSLCHPLGGRVGRDGPSGGTYRPGLASLPWAWAGGVSVLGQLGGVGEGAEATQLGWPGSQPSAPLVVCPGLHPST